ncbi:membrane protein [Micromonospora sp. HK10]|nr:membrane protein [Micromonospora sp. HK10]
MARRPAADRTPRRRPADVLVLAVEAALLAAAVLVGLVLNRRGVGLHADAAPLYAAWHPHVGWGTPLALLVAGVVLGPGLRWARTARWGPLLAAGWLAAVAWTLALALVDGWSVGLTRRLTPQAEYLHEVPGVVDIPRMLAGFTARILDFQPDSWSTHTAGHPPGALLVFVWLDRVGLGGGTAAALCCVLVGATAAVSVPVTLRALGAADAARAVLPFLVLLPGAVWIGASGDAVFTGVVAAGLALLAVRGPVAALAGGLLLGFALYLSYGFVLVGVLAAVVLALRRDRRAAALVAAAAGVAAVTAVFLLAGFRWWEGYDRVVERYYQGWAADRPYGYWVWANLAALLLSAGPVLGPALRRTALAARAAWRSPAAPTPPPGPGDRRVRAGRAVDRRVRALGPTVLLPAGAALAVLAADLSGMSKAEVERIWLPFVVWLLVAAAHLPAPARRWWLAGQALTALAVNHLLLTVS